VMLCSRAVSSNTTPGFSASFLRRSAMGACMVVLGERGRILLHLKTFGTSTLRSSQFGTGKPFSRRNA
jgi:hypothetical protein